MKVCIVTTGAAEVEPRARKQAKALKAHWPSWEVILMDALPYRAIQSDILANIGIVRLTRRFPSRQSAVIKLILRKTALLVARLRWSASGELTPALFGIKAIGLSRCLKSLGADVYVVHGIDGLYPAMVAAQAVSGKVVFDSMEYYSDMGDGQSQEWQRAVRKLEQFALPRCSLVLAASEEIADLLTKQYGISRPTAIYNTPDIAKVLPDKGDRFTLYWRNYQIGFGQRGLDDALLALRLLPEQIELHLQGRPPHDGGIALWRRVEELQLGGRVFLKPPFSPGEAIREAAPHTIGLCLERKGPLNHEVTVSNKLFDYMMAGLAVVSADLPSLRRVVEASGSGELFDPGSPESLAIVVRRLFDNPVLLNRRSTMARDFALRRGNAAADNLRFLKAFSRNVAGDC